MTHRSKRDIFIQHVGQTSTYPLGLEIDSAEGVFIFDVNGKPYFDLNSGISVSSLGHRHPKVIKAIKGQLDRYMHTMVYGEHIQSPQLNFATLLASQLDPSLNSVYFLNSGTEVIEAGMKLMKRVTGRYEIIAAANAYHGSTQGAESLRSDKEYAQAFLPLMPGINHIEFNSTEDLNSITNRTAGVVIEAVQAEAGIVLPEPNYLKQLQARCNEVGAMLLLDEIQTGFGRTGHLFAHQKYGILPDLMAIGKAMGGGLPIGGLVGHSELLNAFTKYPDLGHITTFGGHPIPSTAAHAALKVLIEEGIVEQVLELEQLVHNKLQHPIIKEIRSSGLMM
ncbi:MAG: aspartate aminotransferase family protein, partial [Saprospiraceae bacterium]|nr:aspartate aminotransferase family protein [Saprospiraceae bacterium]